MIIAIARRSAISGVNTRGRRGERSSRYHRSRTISPSATKASTRMTLAMRYEPSAGDGWSTLPGAAITSPARRPTARSATIGMTQVLDDIIARKRVEVAKAKQATPLKVLEERVAAHNEAADALWSEAEAAKAGDDVKAAIEACLEIRDECHVADGESVAKAKELLADCRADVEIARKHRRLLAGTEDWK